MVVVSPFNCLYGDGVKVLLFYCLVERGHVKQQSRRDSVRGVSYAHDKGGGQFGKKY